MDGNMPDLSALPPRRVTHNKKKRRPARSASIIKKEGRDHGRSLKAEPMTRVERRKAEKERLLNPEGMERAERTASQPGRPRKRRKKRAAGVVVANIILLLFLLTIVATFFGYFLLIGEPPL
ncbi:hypothetical protein [Caenibacillus caldisaponilyticus]|jgi:hypothetical protein|uniref:hypothetical protein n=1 Tax=Caenibacillus caldisaponilyticus TaxID=1674942 RepID=UPI0009888627|nr:hypothetical protein [Caenibacillus caldisaponilyticus]